MSGLFWCFVGGIYFAENLNRFRVLTALSSRQACTPEGRRRWSVSGAWSRLTNSHDSDITRITALPRRLTLIPLKEEGVSRGNFLWEDLWNDYVIAWPRANCQPNGSSFVWLGRQKATETRGKTRRCQSRSDVTPRESDSGPLRANRRIVSHYPIWRSRPSSLKGSLIATSQSGRGEETTTSMANLRSVVSAIK